MYIKEISIKGYKSFADYTQFDLSKGISSIFGSSDSGKSNIADAVKWVLGEVSPKAMRVKEMSDVIFHGTENRKGMGYAEVNLIIDNNDYQLPLESSEIRITRRVYLDNSSEYLINRSQCRLKDVNALFLDTGIGRNGYCIIGKGEVAAIFNKKPKDRRPFFDEATGIMKYKIRMCEAQKKLELANNNLKRIHEIITLMEEFLKNDKLYPEEYKMTKGRYDFMILQKNDMEQLRDNLLKVISEMTQNMKAQFVENINSINIRFKKHFKELAGGSAEVKLINEDNVLESGIEIYVQVPGKEMQLTAKLSDNERTLAALALLLSFRIKSFNQILIFDELEAVLDEMNVSKVVGYIMGDSFYNAQFIFITNNSKFAEASDSLYEIKNNQGTSIISNKVHCAI